MNFQGSFSGSAITCAPRAEKLLVKLIQSLDRQVHNVRVVSQLAGRLLVRALAEHHLEVVSRQKAPALGTIAEVTSKSQHVNIERRGFLQISNGENTTGIDYAVHVLTPSQSTPHVVSHFLLNSYSTYIAVDAFICATTSIKIYRPGF